MKDSKWKLKLLEMESSDGEREESTNKEKNNSEFRTEKLEK